MRRWMFLHIVKITTPLNAIPNKHTNNSIVTKNVFHFAMASISWVPYQTVHSLMESKVVVVWTERLLPALKLPKPRRRKVILIFHDWKIVFSFCTCKVRPFLCALSGSRKFTSAFNTRAVVEILHNLFKTPNVLLNYCYLPTLVTFLFIFLVFIHVLGTENKLFACEVVSNLVSCLHAVKSFVLL